jgi:hypothetical protein
MSLENPRVGSNDNLNPHVRATTLLVEKAWIPCGRGATGPRDGPSRVTPTTGRSSPLTERECVRDPKFIVNTNTDTFTAEGYETETNIP